MVSGNILSALIVLVSGIVNICKRLTKKNISNKVSSKIKEITPIENNDFRQNNVSSKPEEIKETFSANNNSAIGLHPSIYQMQKHQSHNHKYPKPRVQFRVLKFD